MTLEELSEIVVEGFKKVDQRFARIDERFTRIDERFTRIDERFTRIDERFGEIRDEMREYHLQIEARLHHEHETTRRHFDVMVEKVESAVRMVAEGHGHLRTIVENHEIRLQAIEKRT